MIANIDVYNIGMINGFGMYKTKTIAISESKLKALCMMWFFEYFLLIKNCLNISSIHSSLTN